MYRAAFRCPFNDRSLPARRPPRATQWHTNEYERKQWYHTFFLPLKNCEVASFQWPKNNAYGTWTCPKERQCVVHGCLFNRCVMFVFVFCCFVDKWETAFVQEYALTLNSWRSVGICTFFVPSLFLMSLIEHKQNIFQHLAVSKIFATTLLCYINFIQLTKPT